MMTQATTKAAKRVAKKKTTSKAKTSQVEDKQLDMKPAQKPKIDEKDRQAKLDALIVKLRAAKFSHEKKRIRRTMRSLGHKGGLKTIDAN